MAKYRVATVDEIPIGGRKLIDIGGRSIGFFNINGDYFALRNICPHQGGALCEGRLTGFLTADVPGEYEYTRRGEILRCRWHGWEFDVKTGQSWVDPEKTRVRTYTVSVEKIEKQEKAPTVDDGSGRVQGPYVAESYAISIEEMLVFVEI